MIISSTFTQVVTYKKNSLKFTNKKGLFQQYHNAIILSNKNLICRNMIEYNINIM